MIDGTYDFEIDTPMGRQSGRIVLRSEGERAIADIDAPIIGNQHVEGQLEGTDGFSAHGSFSVFLMGTITYTLTGNVDGDSLHASIVSSKADFNIEGQRGA